MNNKVVEVWGKQLVPQGLKAPLQCSLTRISVLFSVGNTRLRCNILDHFLCINEIDLDYFHVHAGLMPIYLVSSHDFGVR